MTESNECQMELKLENMKPKIQAKGWIVLVIQVRGIIKNARMCE